MKIAALIKKLRMMTKTSRKMKMNSKETESADDLNQMKMMRLKPLMVLKE